MRQTSVYVGAKVYLVREFRIRRSPWRQIQDPLCFQTVLRVKSKLHFLNSKQCGVATWIYPSVWNWMLESIKLESRGSLSWDCPTIILLLISTLWLQASFHHGHYTSHWNRADRWPHSWSQSFTRNPSGPGFPRNIYMDLKTPQLNSVIYLILFGLCRLYRTGRPCLFTKLGRSRALGTVAVRVELRHLHRHQPGRPSKPNPRRTDLLERLRLCWIPPEPVHYAPGCHPSDP